MYRFHTNNPIYFKHDIKFEIQAMGGGLWDNVKKVIECDSTVVTYDDGDIHSVCKKRN